VRSEHQNKNFCKLLPLLDLIFGTAHLPAPDEFPPTGLGVGEKASGWLDGLIWPFRRYLRWHVSGVMQFAVTRGAGRTLAPVDPAARTDAVSGA